ncbi:GNAT family N-acetyltransferase [Streptomyces sp. NBC_00335]|uniref:GNAT family N-acetyltransferase n=1 Tax=unclassified Streptomyces TaxID=2593676 RepID=UPI0022525796|nr:MULTISPECIES: GNAT family N-acetyltransferase [unclassified Streptomyces]MCX5409573.1 GNAT family N-acetyltransferase [Streptomyces sp. NBC_00086]
MNEVRAVIRPMGEPGDLGWVVMAHGEQYAKEFGWDISFEALVARIVADYAAGRDPSREEAWIAELDGRRVGSVFCVAGKEGDERERSTATLRILLVDPAARGHRLGSRLVAQCVDFAREAGYERIRLWTNDTLVAARGIYLAAGFRLVEEEPHHSFGADLIGQVYELDLSA